MPPALAEFARVPALAVRARRRFGALSLPRGVRFTDDLGLADLRRGHPEWRAEPLAPVDVVQDPWSLPEEADGSLACLIHFELLAASGRLQEALLRAAEVLLPGGALIAPMNKASEHNDQHIATGDFERTLQTVAALDGLYDTDFELEQITRLGLEHVVVLVRREATLEQDDLVEHRGRVMIMDKGRLRPVANPATLAIVLRPGQSILAVTDRLLARAQLGETLTLEAAQILRSRPS